MRVFVPRERSETEKRVSLIPESVKRLVGLGFEVVIESGAGSRSSFSDSDFEAAGASVSADRAAELAAADIVFRVGKPSLQEASSQKSGSWSIGFLDPFNETALIEAFAKAGVTAVSMEMIPRTTLAQKMDGLSSQANLAGYFAVIKAAERLGKILPMMMTPAGTLSPARVFVIGVGVAGLQAIATAKRLGARVEAFDTRPVVEEQVKSLGAKFVKIDLGEMGQTDQGYAKELTDEQKEKQKAGMAKVCGQSNIVITTAKLFGRPAPRIVDGRMLSGMKNGSVVVDLAVESGGNVEGSKLDEEVVTENGVKIIGIGKLECGVASDASQMYSANLHNFIEHFWDKESKTLKEDLEDEILKGCIITKGGAIVHERFRKDS
ncbi:Re/Si-specific NAD(P)(+) transhydrogenase subunit alpha [Pelagicoccus sp. SDUM812003]|uniref:Re/Si-specific NAD(P)(+) transhydrogenase subunit alpha n=1 Tax=Pelagicoccus sp. SDUM812003 TaxID=3041267 RepID=UPI002810010B|nr:Re/Si-specific NAD(P)(+) transhydrogenase subunit alpha [Pelagicoccus sp. SDUM812003]MDQ8202670.1 Re/Si-specific NAD(P)(+) transhydrogenase subunit alpha [Pelagicoccus sp. SDUM812003]